jgi:hypothetical protein
VSHAVGVTVAILVAVLVVVRVVVALYFWLWLDSCSGPRQLHLLLPENTLCASVAQHLATGAQTLRAACSECAPSVIARTHHSAKCWIVLVLL